MLLNSVQQTSLTVVTAVKNKNEDAYLSPAPNTTSFPRVGVAGAAGVFAFKTAAKSRSCAARYAEQRGDDACVCATTPWRQFARRALHKVEAPSQNSRSWKYKTNE